ncbi:MAG: HDOD domain-containing protein, partial [Hyphomicrobiales bacterium]
MQHHHVNAGNFYVGPEQPLILEAYLGTCVGVALVDSDAGIGGIGHFLLPEPVSLESSFQKEKYASSGMPLFLKALYDAGGRRECLKATLAGGALVGPIDNLDLNLNIGGRTTEIAEQILRLEDIPIDKAETGGFFSCSISLDMQTWNCRIEPCGVEKMSGSCPTALPTPEQIDRAVEQLQPVPQAALKIMRLIDEEEYDIRTVAGELRKDQVLTARTLKLANSVMFASPNRIESIDHALMYLGVNLLAKFVIAAAVEDYFTQSGSGYSLCKGGLYHHAVGTAVISEKLAKLTTAAKPGLAYTAGLLHDIGKVVLDQFVAGAAPLFYRRLIEDQTEDFTQAEEVLFGTTHSEAGYRLAKKWTFPDSLAEAIRHHHQPEQGNRNGELTHIICVANRIMSRFHAGLQIEKQDTGALASRLKAIGLSVNQFAQIVDMIP